jgi:DNA replication licensing factor MCM3
MFYLRRLEAHYLIQGSLLNHPFDYSQAFDKALKNVIASIPNRPAKETADEVVRLTFYLR